MRCPTLSELPTPPSSKRGWPWTDETQPSGLDVPRISIVTPSYNQAGFLEETIRSVLLQGCPDLEYLIIDGGSSDGSVDIIRKYERWLTYWVSEPDRGQCHAINKGLWKATGRYFNYVNSDDLLAPGAVVAIASAFHTHPSAHIVHGKCTLADEHGRAMRVHQGRGRNFEEMFTSLATGNGLHPLAVFTLRSAVIDAGGYREQLEYEMDADLWFRLLDREREVRTIEACLGTFRCHGAQKSSSHRRIDELLAVLCEAIDRQPDINGTKREQLRGLAARQCARQKLWAASSSFNRRQYCEYMSCCAGAVRMWPRVAGSWVFWTNLAAPMKALIPAHVADAGRRRLRALTGRIEGLHH